MSDMLSAVAQALTQRGFEVHTAATAAQAKELALSLIPQGSSIGIGGSMTVRQLGLTEALEQAGHPVWWHWTSPEERPLVFENARKADVYLASANAVTRDGQLVNIDGTGNRIASMLQGPATVIAIVGRQKLVDGGLTAAIGRIKREACPPNASRLKLNTPCALSGRCNEQACGDDCMCRGMSVVSRPLRGQRHIVVLVDEILGY